MKRLVIEALSLNYVQAFGFQEFLFNILNYLKAHRNEVKADEIIIACKEKDKQAFLNYEPQLKVTAFDIKSKLHRYWVLNTLYGKLNLSKDDTILYTNNYGALTRRCNYLLVIHDLLYLRKEYMPDRAFRLQRAAFVPRSARIADKVIAISQWVKSDVKKQFDIEGEKIRAIYNFFRFDKFQGIAETDVVNAVNGKRYFLVVCSSAYHKNTITTLKAFSKYVVDGGECSLVAVGRFSPTLQAFISTQEDEVRNRIVNLNGVSNASLAHLYKNAYAYISATLFEGLGMPIIEAMYFGTPCLLSDIEVVREVSCNMETYFPPLDADSLAQCMHDVKPADKEKVKQIVENTFSTENTVAKYVRLFNEYYGKDELADKQYVKIKRGG